MGFVLKYCVTCGARIPEEDFEAGVAVEWGQKTYCREHVPAEAAAAEAKRKNTSPAVARIRRQSGRTVALTDKPSGSGRKTRASERTESAGSGHTSRDDNDAPRGPVSRPSGSGMAPLIVVGVAVLAIVGALGVILASGGGSGSGGNPTTSGGGDAPGSATAQRLRSLNERTRAELTAWQKFSDAPPADRHSAAVSGFDRVQKLLSDCEDYARTTDDDPALRLPPDRMLVLASLLDKWCREATERNIADIRTLANRTAEQESAEDAIRLLGDILQGRNREHLDSRFIVRLPDSTDTWPGREIRSMIDRLRTRDPAVGQPGMSAENHDAMQELERLARECRRWQDETRMDDGWWQTGLDWMRLFVELPREFPAVENAVPPDGNPSSRHRELIRSVADQLFEFLDRAWRSLDRNDGAATAAFSRKALEFIDEAPSWLPMHGTVQMWQRELLRGGVQDPGPSSGTSGVVARLKAAERDARAAASKTEFTDLLRAFARLQTAMSLVQLTEARTQELANLLGRIHARMWERLNATVADVGGTPRQAPWRAAAFFFFQMSGFSQTTQPFQSRIQQLSGRFGPHPASDWAAMYQFLETTRDGDDPTGETSDALWTYYQALSAMVMRIYQQQQSDELRNVANASASLCLQVVLRRNPDSLKSSQEAARMQAQLTWCLRTFGAAASQEELASTLQARIQRCSELAGSLPAARE